MDVSFHSHTHSRSGLRRYRKYLRPEVVRACLLTFLLCLLIVLPIGFSAQRRISDLRSQVRVLKATLASLEPPSPAAPSRLPPPDAGLSTVRTTRVSRPLASPATGAASRVSRPRPTAPIEPAVAARADALRRHLSLLPNGMVLSNRTAVLTEFGEQLAAGYTALAGGRAADAAVLFRAVTNAYPEWPYGYYYVALAEKDRPAMKQSAERFAAADEAAVLPLEGRIYWALALLFLEEFRAAEEQLEILAARPAASRLAVGSLYLPLPLPPHIETLCQRIPVLAGAGRIPRLPPRPGGPGQP